jgi:uncharacterized membrane protein
VAGEESAAAEPRQEHPAPPDPSSLPEQSREQQQILLRTAAMLVEHSGPLPHPATLEKYNRIVPGGAQRIFSWVEEQSAHRRRLETLKLEGDIKNERLGQHYGFFIALFVIAGGFALIWNDKDVAGVAMVLSALAVLAGVFVYGQKKQRQEREQKLKSLTAQDDEN